jgi:4-amino-4-deoxy-L-arabinose transferase-like glycosyltransferase
MRYFTFFPSVINHDESTYIVIGSQLFNGATYFIDYIDTKPIGTFLLYAFFDAFAGENLFVFRLFAAVFIATTSFSIYLIIRLFDKGHLSVLGGILYIFSTSIFVFYGVSPNSELFLAPFSLFAIYLVLKEQNHSIKKLLLIGLLLGLAFLIKFVVLAEIVLVGLYLTYQSYRSKDPTAAFFRNATFASLGFFAPLFLVVIYYSSQGYLNDLLFYTFTVSANYAQGLSLLDRIEYFGDFAWRNFYVIIPFAFSFRLRSKELNEVWAFFTVYFFITFILINYLGKPFGHYQLQLLPSLIICAVIYFKQAKWTKKIKARQLSYGLFLLVLVFSGVQYFYYEKEGDEVLIVSDYLEQEYPSDAVIYTGDYHHILYHLLDKKPPNRYIHRTLLFTESHINTLQIDLKEEARYVLSAEPDVVLLKTLHPINDFSKAIREVYSPVDTLLDGKLLVLEKTDL